MTVQVVHTAPAVWGPSVELENRVFGLIQNALTSREGLVRKFFDPRRDLNDECGYPRVIRMEQYQDLYDRNGTAARVVDVLPQETWQVEPLVCEDDRPEVETPFEKAWKEVGRTLSPPLGLSPGAPSGSFYERPGGNPICEYLKRLDIVSGIGRYGVMLLGLDDGMRLDQPAQYRPGQRLTYLRVFPEMTAEIDRYEADTKSPRYQQPISYRLSLNAPAYDRTSGTLPTFLPSDTKTVHWTRVIHVVDNVLSSEVFGVPRMQPVFNRLLDLDKLYGGSAEMYWRGAFPGLSLETLPALGMEVDIDLAATRQMAEKYMNGLQRYLALIGMTAKSLAPQVVDPSPQVLVQIQAICIKLGIPMRVFMGSERGELASSQDDAAWNDRLRQRAREHVSPRVIVPLVDRLIHLGVLPTPRSFKVWWPDLTSQTGQEKSQIAFQRTQALVQYVKGEGWRIFPPMDFLTRILGFEEYEAKAILENARKEGLLDLNKVQTSGRQDDYTNLGAGRGDSTPPRAA